MKIPRKKEQAFELANYVGALEKDHEAALFALKAIYAAYCNEPDDELPARIEAAIQEFEAAQQLDTGINWGN
mgnify:CR=1 FL=1